MTLARAVAKLVFASGSEGNKLVLRGQEDQWGCNYVSGRADVLLWLQTCLCFALEKKKSIRTSDLQFFNIKPVENCR